MKYWYLACPYTHSDANVRLRRFLAANEAAARLMAEGRAVYSPISMGHPIVQAGAPYGWADWRDLDLAILGSERCKGAIVLMLDGWRESAGVRAEIEAAQALGKPVPYYPPRWWASEEAA